MNFFILMHKYIADIVFNFFGKYIKKITPPSSELLSTFLFLHNFYFIKHFKKHCREILSMDKLFLTDAENDPV